MSNPAAARPDDPPGPPIVNRKVPVRRKNADHRSREYLSETEVAAVGAAAAAQGRHGLRDSTLILVAFRHGLRVVCAGEKVGHRSGGAVPLRAA